MSFPGRQFSQNQDRLWPLTDDGCWQAAVTSAQHTASILSLAPCSVQLVLPDLVSSLRPQGAALTTDSFNYKYPNHNIQPEWEGALTSAWRRRSTELLWRWDRSLLPVINIKPKFSSVSEHSQISWINLKPLCQLHKLTQRIAGLVARNISTASVQIKQCQHRKEKRPKKDHFAHVLS